MCGCAITRNLGCFESCKPINTRVKASVTGTWTARVCFNGVWLKKEVEAVAGADIILQNDFPENMALSLQLFRPDGTWHEFDTYLFTNKICVPV